MNKIDALNEIEIKEWSCCYNECEYVLAENSEENMKKLMNAGFSNKQIDDAIDDDYDSIDLSILAFQHTDANYFSSKDGFSIQ